MIFGYGCECSALRLSPGRMGLNVSRMKLIPIIIPACVLYKERTYKMLGIAKAVHKIRQLQVFLNSHSSACSLAPLQLRARMRPEPLHPHFSLLSPCFPWAWELDGNGGGMCWNCVPDLGNRRPPVHPSKVLIWLMSWIFCLLDSIF